MNPVRQAIYLRLAGDATLTALLSVPTAIYHATVPSSADFPVIVFQRQAGTPVWSFDSAHHQSDVWLIKAITRDTSASRAEDIAARIAVVLTDAPLAVTGRALLGVWREADVEYDEIESGERYSHAGSSYRLVTEPT